MNKISQARQLRRAQTRQEYILWNELRNRRLNGLKFRRQYVIGPYIVDFVNLEMKIVLEVDGGQHNTRKAKIYDQDRTLYLEQNGYKVLRFWNNEVLSNLEGVLTLILTFSQGEKEQDASSQPSPKRRRGE